MIPSNKVSVHGQESCEVFPLNIGTLVAAVERKENPIPAPPSEVQDKISFIMNNVSAANIESKEKEFTESLSIQYYPWFAQYVVMKRVSTERKFHALYLNFLDKVNSRPLYKEIVQATYDNCKVLLGSELIKSSSEERSLLKNLGSWLGKVTIGRNHVLRAREIDPKSLILDAYEKGLLIAIIPFTTKVLESCQSSIVYQPPNPWTMSILGLLAEIYSMPQLKMNLMFDIEVFFKNLGVDIKHVKPTSFLKGRTREVDGNPDFSNKDFGVAQGSQPHMINELESEYISPHNRAELTTNAAGHSKSLSQIMTVTVRSLLKDASDKKTALNPLPYFRFFINLLLDSSSPGPMEDGANYQVLIDFANAFHALQPLNIPAFSFAWLELVSHRSFMPKLLSLNGQKGWPYFQRLLVGLLKFLEPLLRDVERRPSVHLLYKGTLKVLLVLLHDYPEFLCDYHFTFCNVIPSSCIQMRNIVLCSSPRNMRLPNPFTPNLKIDLLPAPRILAEVDAALKEEQMKTHLDEYLSMRQHDSSFLNELKQRLLLPASEADSAGTRYNVPLVNSLVLYVGLQAVQQREAEAEGQWNANVAALQMFKFLSWELDTEGRFMLLSAMANQLRYPNSHTHYFATTILSLFYESDHEIVKEQITRVLLERLIVQQPHPWGLLITLRELIKNDGFWEQKYAPYIKKLIQFVARSYGGLKPDIVST
ncbi:unnamed protein product [Microthlaspi erraticum]|uniref:CCR4-Not complex component Not1 C-terminal domain-containing protein n=1 Tax=Microthlaspi erraticum TaxID=1685480 RepID=A0A6D2KHW7_9BRAS|nr:unnamed protein product [Microthlaspi erraticum]